MGKSRRKKSAPPAATQHAQAGNLLDLVNNSLTPEVVHRASSMIGEPEAATRRTLEAAASTVVGGLSRLASSREGAENLRALLDQNSQQSLTGSVPALFSGGNATASVFSSGEQLLGRIFGRDASSPVTEQVASAGGVKIASARKLLALVASLAVGMLAKRVSAQGFNGSEASNLLTGASDAAEQRPPRDATRGRRWGPVLVPRQDEEDARSRAKMPDERGDESTRNEEDTMAQPAPAAHPVRRIVFLLAALAALALLILLLIRGPARGTSNDAQPHYLGHDANGPSRPLKG